MHVSGTAQRPGESVLHRIPVRWKLLGLALVGASALAAPAPAPLAVLCLTLIGAGLLAKIPFAMLRRPLGTLALFAAAILAFHAASGTFRLGVTSALAVAAAVLAATLVTATTRVSEMVEAFEAGLRPLARLGLDPTKAALALALAIRFIPLLAHDLETMRQARLARGARGLSLALATPLIISALRRGDEVAQAIEARSFGAPVSDEPSRRQEP